MELVEMVFTIPEIEVDGKRPVGRSAAGPQRFKARRIVVQMREGSGAPAGFMFEGRRVLRTRYGVERFPCRFVSEDPLVAEYKLAARRIAAAAQHKATGDPAGRRAS